MNNLHHRRIILAEQGLINKYKLLISIRIEIRTKFIKTFVRSVLTYGRETRTISKKKKKRQEVIRSEMWMWWKKTKTSWREKKNNITQLREIGERKQLMS